MHVCCTQTGARTIRPKVHKNLPDFLREFPALPQAPAQWPADLSRQPDNGAGSRLDWDALIGEALQRWEGCGGMGCVCALLCMVCVCVCMQAHVCVLIRA